MTERRRTEDELEAPVVRLLKPRRRDADISEATLAKLRRTGSSDEVLEVAEQLLRSSTSGAERPPKDMVASIEDADHFWIEAGRMSGEPRHQTEFGEGLVRFFDQATRDNERILIRLPDGSIHERPFVVRGPHHWTAIVRVGLPTAAQGGPQYQDRAIKFTRGHKGATFVYDLDVADPSSEQALLWRRHAAAKGHIGRTGGGGGREYGWW